MAVSLLFLLSLVVKLFALFLMNGDFFFERIDCNFLVLHDGGNDLVLEVVNPLMERCEIAFNRIRAYSEHLEHFINPFSQYASQCFRNIGIMASKHTSNIQLGVRAPHLVLNFDV